MSANAVSRFTCQECGGHNLIVTHVWRIQAGANSERWQEWGPLGDNHNWRYEFREKIENDIENEIQGDGFDDFDEYDSAFESREYEVYQAGHDQQNDEFFVNCETCDREIEFGWSKPGRSGLILPVEFSDFAASECWPAPKYSEAWQQRNWPSMENIKEKSDE